MDEADRAQLDIDREQERLLAAALIRASRVHDDPITHCIDCGDQIPEVRQKHGLELCVDCAEQRERLDRIVARIAQ